MTPCILLSLLTTPALAWELPWIGPRAEVGVSLTKAGEPDADAPPQAAAYAGPGTRIGGGLAVGLTGPFGLAVTVGHHGLFGSSWEDGGRDRLHLGYGQVGPTFTMNDLEFSAGLSWAAGVGRADGFGGCGQSQSEECLLWAELDDDRREAMSWTGSMSVAGGQLGVAWRGFSVTEQLIGGPSLSFGVLTEPSRRYPWVSLGVQLGPAPPEAP